jgi:hypothetical protein
MSPRLNLEDSLLIGKRFEKLIIRLGSKRAALGAVVEAWIVAQRYWKACDNGIPKTVWRTEELAQELIDVDLAEDRGDFVYIRGSKDHFGWLRERTEAGRKGGEAKARNHREKSVAELSKTKQAVPSFSSSSSHSEEKKVPTGSAVASPAGPTLGSRIFEAYADAYQLRYGVEPARNATVNSQCANLGKRLGEQAIEVVRFYVRHNRSFYVQKSHPIGLALQDAESLRTEWLRGEQVTGAAARDVERAQHNLNVWDNVKLPENWGGDGDRK